MWWVETHHLSLLKLKNMRIKDLIEHLQQFDSELPIVLVHTDHTDWTYKWEPNILDVYVEKNVYIDNGDSEIEYPESLIISCTPW